MALLKLYRGAAAPAAEVGKIWFDVENQVIKVYNGTDWEVYGTTPADLAALAERVTVLEGAVKTLNETTLPALKEELEQAIADAVAAEAAIARKAEEDLGKRIDDLAAAAVSVAEGTNNHVKVTKSGTVYTVEGVDIASAKGLEDEIKRAGDEEARIEGLVNTEKGRAEGIEAGLETRLAAVEADYLKAADKTELSDAIASEKTRAEGKEAELLAAIEAEAATARAAEKGLADRLGVIEGEGEGSIKKAVADAKAELVGDAETLKTFGAVEDAIAEVEAAAKAAATLLTVDSEGHVTVNGKQDETTGAWTYTIGEKDIASKAVVDTLVGEDKDMSARAIVQDEVAKQLTSENISDSFDTLKEMAEWLSSHPEDVQEMNDAIGANKTAIEAEVTRATTAEGNLQKAIDNEVSARKAAIEALDADVDSTSTVEALPEGGTYDDPKIAINVVEVDGVVTGVTVVETDIASAAKLHEVEYVASAALNELNARVDGHATRLDELEAGLGAVEHTTVSDGDTTDFVEITETTEGSHKNYAVSATVVKGSKDDKGLATDAYVREQIAAALSWEAGSF